MFSKRDIDPFLNKHLPDAFYKAVEKMGLIDGEVHPFIFEADGNIQYLDVQLIKYKADPLKTNQMNDHVGLKITELDKSGEEENSVSNLFEKGVCVAHFVVQSGVPFVSARKDFLIKTGLSEKECEEISPEIVGDIIKLLEEFRPVDKSVCLVM